MISIKQLKHHFLQITSDKLPYYWLEELLLFILKKEKIFLIVHEDYILTKCEYQLINDGIDKMQQGMPLAYIIGRQYFFGHEFIVNQHTLIPRPDTEILIETVLDFIKKNHLLNGRLLDLGTGSGCIAISLAIALKRWEIMGVDKSFEALNVACLNAQNLKVDNCQFTQSDWFLSITGKWQIIVSNPPYIDKNDKHLLDLVHEPMTALVANDCGLSDIDHIVKHSLDYLCDGGLLVIEHGHDQGELVRDIFHRANFKNIHTIKDYGNNERITMGIYYE